MKKNFFFAFFLICIMLFSASCSDCRSVNVDFITNFDNIYVQTEGNNFSFSVPFCSRKIINTVSFIRFSDPALNNLDYRVDVTDAGAGLLDNYKYRGLYIKYITFTIIGDRAIGEFEFDKFVVGIDGEEKEITLARPICNDFSKENVYSEEFQILVIPIEFGASFINNDENYASYEFEAKQDITITDIRFAAFLTLKNIQYSINHGGFQKATFPITVKKGEKIDLSFSIESDEVNNQSLIKTILCFDFVTNEDNATHYNSFNLCFDPIFPLVNDEMKTVDQVIDRLIERY